MLNARLPEQPGVDGMQALEDRVLPHLTALTYLSLSLISVAQRLESCFLQHISTMISLKHLSVEGNGEGLSLLPVLIAVCCCALLCRDVPEFVSSVDADRAQGMRLPPEILPRC
jgi:hypothetical protein